MFKADHLKREKQAREQRTDHMHYIRVFEAEDRESMSVHLML